MRLKMQEPRSFETSGTTQRTAYYSRRLGLTRNSLDNRKWVTSFCIATPSGIYILSLYNGLYQIHAKPNVSFLPSVSSPKSPSFIYLQFVTVSLYALSIHVYNALHHFPAQHNRRKHIFHHCLAQHNKCNQILHHSSAQHNRRNQILHHCLAQYKCNEILHHYLAQHNRRNQILHHYLAQYNKHN